MHSETSSCYAIPKIRKAFRWREQFVAEFWHQAIGVEYPLVMGGYARGGKEGQGMHGRGVIVVKEAILLLLIPWPIHPCHG